METPDKKKRKIMTHWIIIRILFFFDMLLLLYLMKLHKSRKILPSPINPDDM